MPGLPASRPGGEAQGPRWLGLTLPLVLAQMALGRIKGFFTPFSGKAAVLGLAAGLALEAPFPLV